jgi:hypothetical protein
VPEQHPADETHGVADDGIRERREPEGAVQHQVEDQAGEEAVGGAPVRSAGERRRHRHHQHQVADRPDDPQVGDDPDLRHERHE